MNQLITLEEVNQAITQQEAARDGALAQANFHAGYIAALKEMKGRLRPSEDFPEAIDGEEAAAPSADAPAPNGRKR